MTPKISVIMSVYNETIYQLKNSMDCILWQSFQDFEFIIVSDNPQNRHAQTYIQERQKQDARIIFLQNKHNIQLGASLNRAISVATWEYIARMDADDVCDVTKLEQQYTYLQQHPKVGLLFTGWQEVDEKWTTHIRVPSRRDFAHIHQSFFYKSPLLHASMCVKASVFEKYSYPEIDRPEDFSLFLDLIAAGYQFDVIEKNLYTFYIQTYDVKKKYKKMKIFSSNFLTILHKNIDHYKMNPYFWWMYLLVIIQWVLTRNKYIFYMLFNVLQKIYKRLFI